LHVLAYTFADFHGLFIQHRHVWLVLSQVLAHCFFDGPGNTVHFLTQSLKVADVLLVPRELQPTSIEPHCKGGSQAVMFGSNSANWHVALAKPALNRLCVFVGGLK
jgi:hypothetical protein